MEKQKAAVVKTPINVCVVSLGIVGADKMDKTGKSGKENHK